MKTKVYPSIFCGNITKLYEEVKKIERAGADGIHIDIMDHHFVPNLALSPQVVAAISQITNLYLDVHIMVYEPYDYIQKLVECGANGVTFHFESTVHVKETLAYIKKCGVDAGLAFSPNTSMSFVREYFDQCDKILFMTVNPGFGGQKFIPEVLDNIQLTSQWITEQQAHDRKNSEKKSDHQMIAIAVDGGIDEQTAPKAICAGATHLISGTYLMQGGDMKDKIFRLRG